MSVEPKAKRPAYSYLKISWVQHIDVLPTAQGGIVSEWRWASPGKTDTLEWGLLSPQKGGPQSAGTNTTLPTPEFKKEAVELYRFSGKSIPKIAEELGIASESLRGGGSASTRSTKASERDSPPKSVRS